MQNQEQIKRKTRSQLVDDDKQASRPEIPSQNNLEPIPQFLEIESSKVKQQKQLPVRKSNWNKKQKTKYLVFLNYYSQLPNWGSDLKSIPTYKALSQFVKSRSPQQCKSFHLSTRRNFKSVEEELKVIQEELQLQQGYQKMLDRYEIEIIAFEEEHKILNMFDIQEKRYFHHKLLQKCKENGLNKQPNPDEESPQEHQADYNPKINIRDLIDEKQIQENKRQGQIQSRDQYQPLINMHYGNMQKEGNYINAMNPSMSQSHPNIPGMMMPNQQHPGMNYYDQQFNPMGPNKNMDKSAMESMRQQGINKPNPNLSGRNIQNPNERFMQENINRLMEANKNFYGQYPNYGPYAPSPYGNMNPMHMAQFRNQMPFSIPPPGGIPYMIQGYQQPYGMGNTQSRFGPIAEDQNGKSQISRNQNQSMGRVAVDKNKVHSNQPKQAKVYSERRKQLLLNCHQHWVNWLRAVNELNKRKEVGRDLVVNNSQ